MTTTLDIRMAAGRVIVGGFAGLQLPDEVAGALSAERLGGAILFARNVESAEQVVALNAAIHARRPDGAPALVVAVDQEGGKVARLRGIATDFPPAARFGDVGDADLCTRAGEVFAAELWSLGFNIDCAPVMDVHTEPSNPVIGDRAFSTDPDRVARLAGAFALGLLTGGVAPCAKHFPGHGDTRVDSHIDLPVIDHGRERLQAIEWVPFAAAARARLPMIMTAHVKVPALDAEHPATFSTTILQDVLRQHLGFRGVIVSDDLEMGAVADRYEIDQMAELGLAAGVDLFLLCHQRERQERLREAFIRLAESSANARQRLLAAATRVTALRRDFLQAPPVPETNWAAVLRCRAHLDVAAELERRVQS